MFEPSPPPPRYILRSHSSTVTTLFISLDNERIYSGDGSGFVVSTSTRTGYVLYPLGRPTTMDYSIYRSGEQTLSRTPLSIDIIGSTVYSKECRQGQDNKLHVWLRVEELPGIGGSVALSESSIPVLQYSVDVNALNYCRFSLMPLPPNGKGIIMSLHLFEHNGALRILIAYESGNVALREFVKSDRTTSVEGLGWKVLWMVKLHARHRPEGALLPVANLGVRDRPCQPVYNGDV